MIPRTGRGLLLCALLLTGCVRLHFWDQVGDDGDHQGIEDGGSKEVYVPPDAYPQQDHFLIPDGGCPPHLTPCDNICVDLTEDPFHCGHCGKACDPGQDCVGSQCRCKEGGLCTGCCEGEVCRALSTGQDKTRCGNFGKPCVSCDDSLSCTDDVCTANGECNGTLKPGYCLVDKVCYKAGDLNPKDACGKCDPALDPKGWTVVKGCVTTIAGSGVSGYADGPVLQAKFLAPSGVAVRDLPNGVEVYVADRGNNRIRMFTPGGVVTTVAGSGTQGHKDAAASSARFFWPEELAVVEKGSGVVIYVADTQNHCIRKIEKGAVTTVAGVPQQKGFEDGALLVAKFDLPTGVALDSKGTIYVADMNNHRIRVIDAAVSTLAGTGQEGTQDGPVMSATFNMPIDVALLPGSAEVFTAGFLSNKIRRISGGVVATVAGTGTPGFIDGPAIVAAFKNPEGLAVTQNTSKKAVVYVADAENARVRRIEQGIVSTYAGGSIGYKDGPLAVSQFIEPVSLAIDAKGRIFVADRPNNRIRMIIPP